MDRSIDGGNQYPIVSICCTTYNHARFIRQCMDGFLQQKTNFPIEVLIHDDASTDGTQDVIREYEVRYPEIVKPIYQKENQYSKGIKINLVYNYSRARGKYIALCEGDDYWTDPYKLQKQVDFLDSHPDYVMCSHKWNNYIENENKTDYGIPLEVGWSGKVYNLDSLVNGEWYFQPLTVLFRRHAIDFKKYGLYKNSKDITLFYVLLKTGKGFCLHDVMATYRIHSGGIWSGVGLNCRRKQDFITKIGIFEVEKSKEAATFILYEFTKLISRAWMLKQIKIFWIVSKIFFKHFGALFTLRLFLDKVLFNKVFVWKRSFNRL